MIFVLNEVVDHLPVVQHLQSSFPGDRQRVEMDVV